MFAIVRYGDEQEYIININCRNVILLQFMKEQARCCAEDEVEVSDEKGQLKNLRVHLRDNARKYIKDRERLILLKVHNDRLSSVSGNRAPYRAVYTPLLLSLVSNTEFNAALNPPRDEEAICEIVSNKSSKTRSLAFEGDDFKRAKSKSRLSTSSRKSTSRRGRKSSHQL